MLLILSVNCHVAEMMFVLLFTELSGMSQWQWITHITND